MSSAETHTRRRRRLAPRWPLLVALVAAAALAFAIGLAYLARRDVVERVLVGWLEQRGVPASVEFERVGPGGAIARIQAGTPGDPDFTVERAEIDYGLLGFWTGDPLGLDVRRVRLVRPVVRGSYRDGQLSFGALDPIIEEFRRRPPRPDATRPVILIEDGVVGLTTDYGLARLRGDARIEDNKLMSLNARLAPGAAKVNGADVAVRGGEISLRTRGDRVAFSLGAILSEAVGEDLALREGYLRLAGEGPYPDFEKRRGDGAVALTLTGGARELQLEDSRLHGAEFAARFNGRATGWLDDLAVGGRGGFEARAESGEAAGYALRRVTLEAEAPTLGWTRTGPDRLNAQGRVSLQAGEVAGRDLRLQALTANLRGSATHAEAEGARWRLTGGASARGAWTGLGPPSQDDDPGIAALKRTLRAFEVRAPAVSLDRTGRGLAVGLGAPARLTSAGGGEIVLSSRGGAAVYEGGRGAFLLRARGGGMPTSEFEVARLEARPGGFAAEARGRLDGDLLVFRDAKLQFAGGLVHQRGAWTLTQRGCTPLRAARLELGDVDAHDFAGVVCPAGGPLVAWGGSGWRVRGQLRETAAVVPDWGVRFADAAGALDVGGGPGPLRLQADVQTARVADTLAQPRFHPLRIGGQASAARGEWRGRFELASRQGHPLGEARLRHEDRSGAGAFEIDTGLLAFAPEDLQPADILPAGEIAASPATGHARFVGGFSWSPQGGSSGGTLTVPSLDFRTPLGPASGARGEIVFSSLDPVAAAPGQEVRAERIAAFTPLTDAVARFHIQDEAVHVASAEMVAARGQVRFEPFQVPFDADQSWTAVMHLEAVELSDVVEASPFAEHVDFEARVDGRVPLQFTPQGVRISGGEMHAVRPGRLSIQREVLTGVAADGGVAEAEPNMTVDFAYQAMENLAFDRLSAEIDSQPGGRLGVMFYVAGRHAPPRPQELRLSWLDLLRGDYMDRALPLPSGVQVNLALDASFNLDEMLADWGEVQRLFDSRTPGSATVQPPTATTAPDPSPGGRP